MANNTRIKIRRSATQGKIPATTDLALGELAINTYDGKIFLKKSVNGTETVVGISSVISYTDLINIPQDIGTTATPTFAGATLNGVTTIKESGTGSQNTLKVAGAGTGSIFAVSVSDTASDGINLKSLTSDLSNSAKLTLSGSSIILKAGTKQLIFNDSGNIVLPVNGDIVDSTNTSVLKFPTVKKVTFDNPVVDSNTSAFYTNATATDSSTNHITVDDSSGLTIGVPITFYGQTAIGGLLAYAVYYVRTIVDGTTITVTDTKGGTTDVVVTTDSGSMIVATMTATSFQTQRAPRQWTNYDSLATTGHDYSEVTFGDTYYDDVAQHVYMYVNFGRGIPEPLDVTPL
jgi:hypothetical protein